MISVTRLLTDAKHFGDSLRYSATAHRSPDGTSEGRGPVVVWNSTLACNLECMHCYMDARPQSRKDELSTAEAKAFIDDLAAFRTPVLLLSGGEPLVRPDFYELAEYAATAGIRPTVSTNGTLITREVAQRLKDIGVGYVGISLDGLEEVNDRFRRKKGAFAAAMRGIENCVAVGQRVGLRFTINQHNVGQIGPILDLMETANINRICFYHLVYSGRGGAMLDQDVSPTETRQAVDLIIDRTLDFAARGLDKEVLTVDNHADGPYIYLRLLRENPERAAKVLQLLEANGGNRSGMAFAAVDPEGNVHPDQFTQYVTFGNIRQRKFSEIWTDRGHPVMAGLKNRQPLLKGRCATCRFLSMCNGNLRTRAEAVHGDFWAPDPACYLTDEEIAVGGGESAAKGRAAAGMGGV